MGGQKYIHNNFFCKIKIVCVCIFFRKCVFCFYFGCLNFEKKYFTSFRSLTRNMYIFFRNSTSFWFPVLENFKIVTYVLFDFGFFYSTDIFNSWDGNMDIIFKKITFLPLCQIWKKWSYGRGTGRSKGQRPVSFM